MANALETIERNAKLQTQLIEDLLDVSRIIRGKLRLHVAPLNLITPIDAAIATMRPAAEAKSIQIRPLLDAQVGTISGDASRLQQVFWNLLSNAIKFTPVGGQVEVRLEQVGNRQSAIGNGENQSHSPLPTPHSPTYAQITVTDNGQGIAPEFLPYVFDSFRQADASTTRNYNGLGLGLAIVRHLVELHGGTVSANSLGEGQGATFIVKLPLLLDTEPATREQSETEQEQTHSSLSEEPISEAPASTTTPALTRKSDINNSNQAEAVASMEPIRTFNLMLTKVRVLVVDDAPDSREFVEFVLKENGAIVRSAASVDEAIGILKQFFPHVLVSDLSMPESDGYNLIHQIKQLQAQLLAVTPSPHNSLTCYSSDFSDDLSRRPSAAKELANLKAIALTARAAAEDRQRAISAGFQHYLTKPIEPSELISAISNLLEDHQKMPQ